MITVEFLEVENKGKKLFFADGKRISADVAFKLVLYASSSASYYVECNGDTVRRTKTLCFYSDDVYIVNGLLGE